MSDCNTFFFSLVLQNKIILSLRVRLFVMVLNFQLKKIGDTKSKTCNNYYNNVYPGSSTHPKVVFREGLHPIELQFGNVYTPDSKMAASKFSAKVKRFFCDFSVFMEPEKPSTRMKTKKTKMLMSFKNMFCNNRHTQKFVLNLNI